MIDKINFAPQIPDNLFQKSPKSFSGKWTKLANPGGQFRLRNMQPVTKLPYVYMQDYLALRKPSLGFKLYDEGSTHRSSIDIDDYCS